jgi:hypothetical protein
MHISGERRNAYNGLMRKHLERRPLRTPTMGLQEKLDWYGMEIYFEHGRRM